MKQRKVKVPYSNYELPPSAELGGKFVDFNEVLKLKKVQLRKCGKGMKMP